MSQIAVEEIARDAAAIKGAIESVLNLVHEFETDPARATMYSNKYSPLSVKAEAVAVVEGADLALEAIGDMPKDILKNLQTLANHLSMNQKIMQAQQAALQEVATSAENVVARLLTYLTNNNNKVCNLKEALRFVKTPEMDDCEDKSLVEQFKSMAGRLVGEDEAERSAPASEA